MNNPPRVALFTDCFHEVNGAAHSCRHLVRYAASHSLPLLSVHSGPRTGLMKEGSVTKLELQRGSATIPVDVDFGCDFMLWRYAKLVEKVLVAFRPDLVHVISPADFSGLGVYLAYRLRLPLVASFHTQLHQYAATRLRQAIGFLPSILREPVVSLVQKTCLAGMVRFYKIPRMLLGPTPEICHWLEQSTGRPCRSMGRGVDTVRFNPAWRDTNDDIVRLGYVGRLTVEKNVRFLAEVEQALLARGKRNYRFVIVGEGSERVWLASRLKQAEFAGVLTEDDLSRAYANFDLFLFPSHTDAFGNVVQEAMASGVPVILTADGGPKFVIDHGVNGFVTSSGTEFINSVTSLTDDRQLRRRMGVAAREAMSTRTWELVLSDLYGHYQELCQSAVLKSVCATRTGQSTRFSNPKAKPLAYVTSAGKQES